MGVFNNLQEGTVLTVGNQVQGSTNRRALGLGNFVPALAYHFCLNLPAAVQHSRNQGPTMSAALYMALMYDVS